MTASNTERRFGHAVDLIYASVLSPEKIAPAMAVICEELGAIAGQYLNMDIERREVIGSCVSNRDYQAGDREYAEYYSKVDDRLGWLAAGKIGEWRADHEHFDETFVCKSEIYNDFLFKYGGRHMIVGRIGEIQGRSEVLALLRPIGAPEYQIADYHFLDRLAPHLVRSAALRARLQKLELIQSENESMVEHLPYGTIWVNATGFIVSMNLLAADILAANDGIRVRNGRLSATVPADAEQLRSGLSLATGAHPRQGQWFSIKRTRQNVPLLLSIIPGAIPIAQDPLCGGPFALLILQDMTRQRLSRMSQLQVAYGLTPAETRMAEALLGNETIESYANKTGVSRNTVRTHLASLFAKTNTRRQAELLRVLLTS